MTTAADVELMQRIIEQVVFECRGGNHELSYVPRISGLFLAKSERDEDLFFALTDWADDERRSVGAQILYILDKVVADRAKGLSL